MHKVIDYESSDAVIRYAARRHPKARKARAARLKPADMVAECCGYTIL